MRWKSLTLIPGYIAPSSWWQHVPVAHWLVEAIQPKTIVELGTHFGVSFFAFCEAAKALSPNSTVYAVDTWEGDAHAGSYGEDVYKQVYSHWFTHYRGIGTLVRSTFDQAGDYFPAASIDLLHIDGLHTYEAVKHDFESWLPRLKKGSIVLFHDINVREREFGAWQLWDELSRNSDFRGYTINNGYGLGVLYLGQEDPHWEAEFRDILPTLKAKGELLESIAELTPGGSFGHRDSRKPLQEAEERLGEALRQADASRLAEQQAKEESKAAQEAAEAAQEAAKAARSESEAAKKEIQRMLNSKRWKLVDTLLGTKKANNSEA